MRFRYSLLFSLACISFCYGQDAQQQPPPPGGGQRDQRPNPGQAEPAIGGQGMSQQPQERAVTVIPVVSFSAPFTDHDSYGMRYVPYWELQGDALVKQNFLRVASDKTFTKGIAYSREVIGHPSFSLEWKFRVSGRGEKQGGESLGLFVTEKQVAAHGPVFGYQENFIGFGLVIDTKRNAGERHRDISIVVNDGRQRSDEVLSKLTGCNASLRYWEGRDDFSVLKSSRLRVKYSDEMLVVEVDSRNTGRWRRCGSLKDPGLPAGWARRAGLTLVAVNEDESNNNDVLSLKVFSDLDGAWHTEQYDEQEDEFDVLIHHIEHEMFTVQAGLQEAITSLEHSESESEMRIAMLERRLGEDINKQLNDRLVRLENEVHSQVSQAIDRRISHTETTMYKNMEETIKQKVVSAGRSWRYPFYGLVGIVGAFGIVSYFKIKELKKDHLL